MAALESCYEFPNVKLTLRNLENPSSSLNMRVFKCVERHLRMSSRHLKNITLESSPYVKGKVIKAFCGVTSEALVLFPETPRFFPSLVSPFFFIPLRSRRSRKCACYSNQHVQHAITSVERTFEPLHLSCLQKLGKSSNVRGIYDDRKD